MSFLDKYEYGPPKRYGKPRKTTVSRNEKLAKQFEQIALNLKKNIPTPSFTRITPQFVRCTPRVGGKAGEPLLGRTDTRANCIDFKNVDEAANFYEGLAQAILSGDQEVLKRIKEARAANGQRSAKYRK